MSNPFEYLNAINTTKQNLMRGSDNDELAEKDYNAFMVNRGLSYFQDTILLANEMNTKHYLDKKPQFEFLINTVRPRKRFSKWFKQADNDDLDAIKEYYRYSNSKALQALSVLSKNDIEIIKTKLYKGGSK